MGLCGGGCGFFGTAENGGLCSKCYNERLKEIIAKTQTQLADDFNKYVVIDVPKQINQEPAAAAMASSISIPIPIPSSKSRCSACRRKLGLLGFECRCGAAFCSSHRHPEAHGCTFDFKQPAKIAILHQNPICQPDKMTRRI